MKLIDKIAYKQELVKAIDRNICMTGRPDPVVLMTLKYAIAKLDSAPVVDAVPIEVIERYREELIRHRNILPQYTMLWAMLDADVSAVDEILKYNQKGKPHGTD